MHTESSPLIRSRLLHEAACESKSSKTDANLIGVAGFTRVFDTENSLIKLCSVFFEGFHKVLLKAKSEKVVSAFLDLYGSTFVEPDRLLTALSKDVVGTFFNQLLTLKKRARSRMKSMVCATPRDTSLISQAEFRTQKMQILNSRTLCSVYCVPLVCSTVLPAGLELMIVEKYLVFVNPLVLLLQF